MLGTNQIVQMNTSNEQKREIIRLSTFDCKSCSNWINRSSSLRNTPCSHSEEVCAHINEETKTITIHRRPSYCHYTCSDDVDLGIYCQCDEITYRYVGDDIPEIVTEELTNDEKLVTVPVRTCASYHH